MIGQLLAGHYKVLKVLGEGGFGQTYIVEDIHLPGKPKCVLKHLKPSSTDPQVLATGRKLFQKEAETLQRLGTHDHIPRLLAYFEESQEFYLVQEYIYGHPLSQELPPGKKWTESQIIQMLIEVLSILQFVHSQGVIHRDIKPDNLIRRAADKKLVLIDFGAIKQLHNQTAIGAGHQNFTVTIGTPGYMPSEHTRRVPRPSSDIYALGMMGIQALTGVRPHKLQDDPTTGEILWQHLSPVSSELAAVLTKMTRYHFKDRYQTATQALSALKELTDADDTSTIESQVQTSTLHELTLEWTEEQQVKTRKILEHQHSKNPGKIRIGRDPQQCDIILNDPTISALHVEIFFHSQQQKFYLRNLRQRNPPVVDGQLLLAGEMPLQPGSSLRLGQQIFQVSSITCENYPPGYTPIDYITENERELPQTTVKTIRWTKPRPLQQNPIATVPPTISPSAPFANKFPLLIGIGAASVLSTIVGLVLLKTDNLVATNSKQNLISRQSKLCRIVSPRDGKQSVELRFFPLRETEAFKYLNKGDIVLFMQTEDEFVKVKLNDGTQGWVVADQIQLCQYNL
ncbi:MAG: FHA domain-containing serine/threonine-protein kinase [Nostocaceae cyanobacterium]|nr:FHA domain-containing serine/threonine-protein kinase [Nostocaceae cyanobacterium]